VTTREDQELHFLQLARDAAFGPNGNRAARRLATRLVARGELLRVDRGLYRTTALGLARLDTPKRGRPRSPLDQRIQVRLRSTERAEWTALAAAQGLELGAFLRAAGAILASNIRASNTDGAKALGAELLKGIARDGLPAMQAWADAMSTPSTDD
jgi:hypothetical protein